MTRISVGIMAIIFLSIISLSLATATSSTLTSQEILKMNMAGKTVYLVPDIVRKNGDNYTWTFSYVKPAMELKPVSNVGVSWVTDWSNASYVVFSSNKTILVRRGEPLLFFVRKAENTYNYLLLMNGKAYNFTVENTKSTGGWVVGHYFIANDFIYDLNTGKIYHGMYVYANDTIWRISIYNATGKVGVLLTGIDGKKWSCTTPVIYGKEIVRTYGNFIEITPDGLHSFYIVPQFPAYMRFEMAFLRGEVLKDIPVMYRIGHAVMPVYVDLKNGVVVNIAGAVVDVSSGNYSIRAYFSLLKGGHVISAGISEVSVGGGVWVVGGRVFVSGVLAGVLNYYANGGWSGVYGHEFVTSVRDARVYHCLTVDHAVLTARIAKINESAVNLTLYELPVIGNMTVNATLWKGVIVPLHGGVVTLDLGKVKLILPLSQDKVKPLLEKYGLLKYVTTAMPSSPVSSTTTVVRTTATSTTTAPETGAVTTSTPVHTTTEVTVPQTGMQTTSAGSGGAGFPVWAIGVAIIFIAVIAAFIVLMKRK